MLTLPATSFVPVVTYPLTQPNVVWRDPKRIAEHTVRDNAYCIPQHYEEQSAYGSTERVQFADRYGGLGVGHAGGSGRCAALNGMQIKGVGRTPLVTAQADALHASGTMTLSEAAADAIWTQILARVLPHGVVPVYAIVLTGGVFTPGQEEGGLPRQRALLMRQFALRPAHYLRSLHFRLNPASDGLCDEALSRTHAVNTLTDAFDLLFGEEVSDHLGIEKINTGLTVFARRCAEQLTTCFGKRLYHGALSPSNIGLDGRLLDFGTMGFVPSYRRQARSPNYPDQWAESGPVFDTLRELRWHIAKYLHKDSERLIAEEDLLAAFDHACRRSRQLQLIKMCGLPARNIRHAPTEKRRQLFRCMRQIYSRGATEPYSEKPPRPDTCGVTPTTARLGHFDLNAILAAASLLDDADLEHGLQSLLGDDALRAEFAALYGEFRRDFIAAIDADLRIAARLYVALQAHRLNADLSFLMRGDSQGTVPNTLTHALRRFEGNPDGIGAFIDATAARGRYLLHDLHGDLPGSFAFEQIEALARMGPGMYDFALQCLEKLQPDDAARARASRFLRGLGLVAERAAA